MTMSATMHKRSDGQTDKQTTLWCQEPISCCIQYNRLYVQFTSKNVKKKLLSVIKTFEKFSSQALCVACAYVRVYSCNTREYSLFPHLWDESCQLHVPDLFASVPSALWQVHDEVRSCVVQSLPVRPSVSRCVYCVHNLGLPLAT